VVTLASLHPQDEDADDDDDVDVDLHAARTLMMQFPWQEWPSPLFVLLI